jgi:NADH dehydrogenase FAD-containing subunit
MNGPQLAVGVLEKTNTRLFRGYPVGTYPHEGRLSLWLFSHTRLKVEMQEMQGLKPFSVMESVHRDQGVEMVLEDAVEACEGSGRVERVRSRGGRVIACDFVVVGLGIEPITEVVASSAILVENGIVVDEYCRTSVEGVYAAGDVANHYHPLFDRRIRAEHWQHAIKHGQAAARNMLGMQNPYDEVYWFWSDQYNYNLQKDVHQSMGLIKAGIKVDLARLRHEAIQVRDLASG